MFGLSKKTALRLLDAEHRRNDLLIQRVSDLEDTVSRQELQIIDLKHQVEEWQQKYDTIHKIAVDIDRQRIKIIKEHA